MPINILLADDHMIVMDALRSIITRLIPDALVSQMNNIDAVLAHLKHTKTELIILDVHIPGGNHFGVVKMVKSIQPETKLFILSSYSSELYAHRYLQEGADAYLCKNVSSSEIKNTIAALILGPQKSGKTVTDAQHSKSRGMSEASLLALLSNRELEVAKLMAEGKSILQIAGLLQLHANTVSTYKVRIFEKLDVGNIAELITVFRNFTN